jgi:hypothetical protein
MSKYTYVHTINNNNNIISNSILPHISRMGLLQVANFAGLVVGNLGSGPLNNRLGYHGVFMVSTGLTFLALVYAAFAVRESIYVNEVRLLEY